jgi:glycine/D-amino acid oxidase-like deaminating enzyme
MIATEPLERATIERAFPHGRTYHDYNHNLTYIRPAPDKSRLLLGGLTGTVEENLEIMATRLHGRLSQIFPDLAGVRLSHCWSGYGAAAFDLYPHVGIHDGMHYAMGYCFAGLPMGTYLGHKAALRVLGSPEAATLFSDLEFPTRSYYWGRPWFVPAAMAYYNWLDRRGG